jgi:superfamily II DNA or RNA helicase
MNRGFGYYEDTDSPGFYTSINNKKEFADNSINSKRIAADCYQYNQRFLANFVNPLTQYNSVLINHQPGLGKTLSSIGIAENFKKHFKIIVFVKNKILELNFRKELIYSCSNYVSKEQLEIISNYPDKGNFDAIELRDLTIKKINSAIDKHYSFYTYGGLLGDNPQNKPKNMNNSVVIFDEIHNAIGNNFYGEIMQIMKKSYNFKTILLSATPVFESITEIFEISNLLNVQQTKNLLPIRGDLLTTKMVVKSVKTPGSFLNDSIAEISAKGKLALKESLRGKVSYLNIDLQNTSFAKKEYIGTPISKKGVSLNILESKMTPIQFKAYSKTILPNQHQSVSSSKGENVLFKDSSDISTMIFPDGSFGKKGYQKYIKARGPNSVLQLSSLKELSPKIHSLVKIVKESPGLIFLYSNYVNYGGTSLLAAALTENGFSNYSTRAPGPKFVVFGEGVSDKKRQKLLSILNDKRNIDGKDIKIIIGSPSISEGVSFKNIRSIHILEPHWNLSRIDQIIGRGIRFRSHSQLPENQRNVKIYLHACVNTKEDSIDFLKYSLAEKKDIASKQVSRLLRDISVDCTLNKKNKISNSRDYTRECNYSKCEYSCEGNSSGKNDISTYSLKIHSPGEYSFIIKTLKNLFTTGFAYTYDFIVKHIKKKDSVVDEENIKFVLAESIGVRGMFENPNGVKSVLTALDGVYFMNPQDHPIDEDFFYKIFKKEIIVKSIPKEYVKKNKSAVKKEEQIVNTNKKIYGTLIDGVFRIINKEENEIQKDQRNVKTGKECKSYSKEQLKDFLKLFKVSTSKTKKEDLCKELEKFMRNNGLLYQ